MAIHFDPANAPDDNPELLPTEATSQPSPSVFVPPPPSAGASIADRAVHMHSFQPQELTKIAKQIKEETDKENKQVLVVSFIEALEGVIFSHAPSLIPSLVMKLFNKHENTEKVYNFGVAIKTSSIILLAIFREQVRGLFEEFFLLDKELLALTIVVNDIPAFQEEIGQGFSFFEEFHGLIDFAKDRDLSDSKEVQIFMPRIMRCFEKWREFSLLLKNIEANPEFQEYVQSVEQRVLAKKQV